MQRSFAFIFALIAISMTIGMDFFQRLSIAKASNESFGVSDYIDGVKDRYAAFKSDNKAHDIADYAPTAQDGWTKRAYAETDVERFFGPAEPLTKEELEQQNVANEMNDNLSVKLLSAGLTSGLKSDAWVYEKGDSAIVLSMKFIPAKIQGMPGGKQLGMMQDIMRMDEVEIDFARVGGVLFEENTGRDDTHSRQLSGHIGRQIDIGMRFIGGSADAVEILAGVNYDGLNSMVKESVEGVGNNNEIAFLAVEKEVETTSSGMSAIAAMVQKLAVRRETIALKVEEEKREQIAQETAQKAQKAPAPQKAKKPQIRRIGGGNCSGNTFKRCTVKTD